MELFFEISGVTFWVVCALVGLGYIGAMVFDA